MRLIIRPAARRDLARIWSDTSERWSAAQADAYLQAIQRRFEGIGEFPSSFPEYRSKVGNFRKAASGEHLIFYRVGDEAVEVVRVLHNRMDVDAIL
ncbi:type II toxin-antitoxin system RelE/ParE family toxin [Erythrobacter sp. NFXS35]|uniref:type II toxin-antitoxin system RelE/ParE family toxin n=1 Tax=Erythrobacter sp. NFXS35 TaxID=2818436 RepID=UPI0032DFE62A